MALSTSRSRTSLQPLQALPIITEDDGAPPAVPSRSKSRRTESNLRTSYQRYSPFHHNNSSTISPHSSNGTLPDRKPVPGSRDHLRDQEWIARRGGWYRLVMIVLVVIGLVVGLSVGLTVGLGKKKQPETDSQDPSLATLFPAGSYSFTTALSAVTTTCTTNPLTWRCYPYSLFSSSTPYISSATFFWTITPKASYSYTITSTPNPFSPNFESLPMLLSDPNTYDERLSFNFTLSKASVAGGPLFEGETESATCWFNQTVMEVVLWTRQAGEYPEGIGNTKVPVNRTEGEGEKKFVPWPFKIEILQQQMGGAGVPDCRVDGVEIRGNDQLGSGRGECGCEYRNFGLQNGNETLARNATGTNLISAVGASGGRGGS